MKQEEIVMMLEIAKLAAARSKAVRMKVGAVVTDSYGNMIAYGYNGTMRGSDNCCEDNVDGRLVTKESVIHAEMNVLAHAARRGISIDGGHIFATHSPCMRCATHLYQAGVRTFTFLEEYRTYSEVEKEVGGYMTFRKHKNV